MNKNSNTIKTAIMSIIFVLVMVSGVIAFMEIEGYDFLNSLFYSLILFLGNYDDEVGSVVISVIRIIAVIYTATTALMVARSIIASLSDFLKSFSKNSIFVYGNNEYTEKFISNASQKTINREGFMNAAYYVLLDEDENNMNFLLENKKALKDKKVYVKSKQFSNVIDGNIRFFSLEEISANNYWKDNLLIDEAFENNEAKKELNIAFVGFNYLAEEYLRKSVVLNIFSSKQEVKYHLFGDVERFEDSHINLDKLNVTCYKDSVLKHKDIIEKADRTLVFIENDISELYDLIGCIEKGKITVISRNNIEKARFNEGHKAGKNENVIIDNYCWLDGVCVPELIINESTINKAKEMNKAYNVKYQYGNYTASSEEQWKDIDTFTRYSNISSCDFGSITMMRLLSKWANKEEKDLVKEDLTKYIKVLAELEHIRWCNYSYYANWRLNPVKQKKFKLHNDLVPFEKLDEPTKHKDEEQLEFVWDFLHQ